jgi:ribonuclease P protein component
VLRSGRSHAGPELVLYVFPRGGGDPARLGLSVSRKVGGAVQRNLVKRLLRDAFAAEHERLPRGTDAVVIARKGASELAVRSGPAGIRAALAALVDKVPGVAPGGSASVAPATSQTEAAGEVVGEDQARKLGVADASTVQELVS